MNCWKKRPFNFLKGYLTIIVKMPWSVHSPFFCHGACCWLCWPFNNLTIVKIPWSVHSPFFCRCAYCLPCQPFNNLTVVNIPWSVHSPFFCSCMCYLPCLPFNSTDWTFRMHKQLWHENCMQLKWGTSGVWGVMCCEVEMLFMGSWKVLCATVGIVRKLDCVVVRV